MTYQESNQQAGLFASSIKQLGLTFGDRVLVILPISPELYVAIAGLQRLGVIPVLLDSLGRQEQLADILQNSQPKAILAPQTILGVFAPALDGYAVHIRIAIDAPESTETSYSFKKMIETAEREEEIVPVEQDDTALITYTTGSSGTPKGVNRTHRFLSAQHYALKRLFPYPAGAVDLPVFPVFALNNIASGITTVIPAINISKPTPADPLTLISQINACGVTHMTLAPSSFKNIAVYCLANGRKLEKVARVLTGGAPISETDVERFVKIAPNSNNWILYGSTEVEPISFIESRDLLTTAEAQEVHTSAVGVNVGKIDEELHYACIAVETGTLKDRTDLTSISVEAGEIGELVVAGENVCEGYYNNENAFLRTKIRDAQGTVWHRTGDLARIDRNGFLWIVGRKHNIIRRGDALYFPVRPEIILRDIANVSNAAYVQSEEHTSGKIIAVVTLGETGEQQEQQCRKEIITRFLEEALPLDAVVFLQDIPMDVRHHSKVDYGKLRKLLHELDV